MSDKTTSGLTPAAPEPPAPIRTQIQSWIADFIQQLVEQETRGWISCFLKRTTSDFDGTQSFSNVTKNWNGKMSNFVCNAPDRNNWASSGKETAITGVSSIKTC